MLSRLICVFAFPAIFALCGAAAAQQSAAAESARCGGVLCDLYYSGVPAGQPAPTALPCHDFVCGMFGGRTPDAPVTAAAEAPPPEPVKPATARKHKKVAKLAVKTADSKPSPEMAPAAK